MKHISLSYVDIVLYRQDVWSSEIFLLKIWRRSVVCHPLWELQVGNLNYRTISGNRSSVLDVLSKSIWHNFPTSFQNQNHPTVMENLSLKTYFNIKPETWMHFLLHLPKVLPPARPKTWSSTRSWRPGHPNTGEPSNSSRQLCSWAAEDASGALCSWLQPPQDDPG